LEQAGITNGTKLRSIELLNNNSSGEVRIYDMYIRVPAGGESPTGICEVDGFAVGKPPKVTQGGRLIIWNNGVKYSAQGIKIE